MVGDITQARIVKAKICKICKGTFEPRVSLQAVCSPKCAQAHAEQKRVKLDAQKAKQERQERRQALDKLKPRGWYVAQAQTAFNRWIRFRDDKLPCISCGEFRNGWDAGHYLARSIRPELRFNEDNCHKQCKFCNNYNKGRASAQYRPRLIERIGPERVEALEAPHPPVRWTIEELKAIRAEYAGRTQNRSCVCK